MAAGEATRGGDGRRGAENLANVIAANIAAVRDLQRQREARAAVLGGFTVPEFQVGGMVRPGLGGGMLAILHPGGFVMRREAVQSLGADFMASLNRAPRFDSGGLVGASRNRPGEIFTCASMPSTP